jgi:hypothetical protein
LQGWLLGFFSNVSFFAPPPAPRCPVLTSPSSITSLACVMPPRLPFRFSINTTSEVVLRLFERRAADKAVATPRLGDLWPFRRSGRRATGKAPPRGKPNKMEASFFVPPAEALQRRLLGRPGRSRRESAADVEVGVEVEVGADGRGAWATVEAVAIGPVAAALAAAAAAGSSSDARAAEPAIPTATRRLGRRASRTYPIHAGGPPREARLA